MSDHGGLRYLFDQPNLNARKARWLATISEFGFEIMYIKGKENRVAGTLSRRIHENCIVVMSSHGTYLLDRILQAGQHDDRYRELMHRLQQVRLHGVLKKIVSGRDAKFTSRFWKELFAGLGIELVFSTTYHLQRNGQTERANRILEDMLRMCVMHQQWRWEEYLPLVEFAYNNGYQESLRTRQFEALYGQSCNTPISWSDPVNRMLIGPDMLAKMEQEMQVIKKNLKETQDRQKIYVNFNMLFKEFQVGEQVYLCIKPKKSSFRIGSCAKIAPWYCGPFKILERIGPIAYRIALSLTMKVHDVFHVSLLKKYVKYVDHVIGWFVLQVELKG
eukprot:PITA_01723